MSKCLIISVLLFLSSTIFADSFKEILDDRSTGNWYYIKKDFQINAETFFEMAGKHFKIEEVEFRISKSKRDPKGFIHETYQQYRDGILILGAEVKIHSNAGGVYLVNGILAKRFKDKKLISKIQAVALISEHHPCERDSIESELVYFEDPLQCGNFNLCYLLRNNCKDIANNKEYILDAEKGEVVFEIADIYQCKGVLKQDTLIYNGIQQTTVFKNNQEYEAKDICRISIDEPITVMSGFGSNPVEIIRSQDKFFNQGLEIPAMQLLWSMEMYYDFLQYTFGRNSFDNLNSRMISTLDSSVTASAGFSAGGSYSLHGKGVKEALNYWVSLDIVGHEWTHGLLFSENVLKWTNESQALSESICDIFGHMSERYAERLYDPSKNYDWYIAEDCDSLAIRNLADPVSFGKPDTYNSLVYLYSNDKYDHSAVNSYWFYLLSNGGQGINNHSSQLYQYQIAGISEDKALDIVYKAIGDYLSSTSEYRDMRLASIQAAEDLYGLCSNEFLSTVEAWNAVGVYDSTNYCNTGTHISQSMLQFGSMVYPNPVNDQFSIRVRTVDSKVKFSLYQYSGQRINFELETISAKEYQISSKDLEKGMYILKIQRPYQVESHKIVFSDK